jgi:hypothetical protein
MGFALAQPAEGKRFHRTILEEFYQVAFRRKVFQSLEELQRDVDEWIAFYNRNLIRGAIAMVRPRCKPGEIACI